jgi:probable DNA metabolism protein
MNILSYDNTLEGFFTAVFEVYEYKYLNPKIVRQSLAQNALFSEVTPIITQQDKADRVTQRLEKQIGKEGLREILFGFLSENENFEDIVFEIIKYGIEYPNQNILKNYAHPAVLQLSKWVKSVGREAHRMEAFVRFELLQDGIYFAQIEPDFNVLPLTISYFKERYQDQKWLVYDTKRNFGIYYDLETVEWIQLDLEIKNITQKHDQTERKYQHLWAEYFDHTNIKERKNTKLHIQHVPKRYWKYLTEKRTF